MSKAKTLLLCNGVLKHEPVNMHTNTCMIDIIAVLVVSPSNVATIHQLMHVGNLKLYRQFDVSNNKMTLNVVECNNLVQSAATMWIT